jgi:hypothetical protein
LKIQVYCIPYFFSIASAISHSMFITHLLNYQCCTKHSEDKQSQQMYRYMYPRLQLLNKIQKKPSEHWTAICPL